MGAVVDRARARGGAEARLGHAPQQIVRVAPHLPLAVGDEREVARRVVLVALDLQQRVGLRDEPVADVVGEGRDVVARVGEARAEARRIGKLSPAADAS